MRMRLLRLIAVLLLVAVACGDGGGDGNDELTEESLTANAEGFARAFLEGDAAEAYEYLHPGYKEECSLQDFRELLVFAQTFIEGFAGDDVKLDEGEYRIDDVSIDGNEGLVQGQFLLDGEELSDDGASEEQWLFENDQWFTTTEEEEPCDTDLDVDIGDPDDPDEDPDASPVDPGEITVEQQGFTHDADSGNVSYGIVLHNESDKAAATDVQLQIAFYDAAGAVMDTTSEAITFVLPGQSAGIGGSTSLSSEPAEMRVQVDTNWSAWDGEDGTITFQNVSQTEDDVFGFKTTGEVNNPFNTTLEDVIISAIYLDAAGNVIGGDQTYHDFIPANGTSPFEIDSFTDVPGIASVEIYGHPFFISLDDLEGE